MASITKRRPDEITIASTPAEHAVMLTPTPPLAATVDDRELIGLETPTGTVHAPHQELPSPAVTADDMPRVEPAPSLAGASAGAGAADTGVALNTLAIARPSHVHAAVDPTVCEEPHFVNIANKALPDVEDIVGKHYKLRQILGTGAFGKVYQAERTDVSSHKVALKVIAREIYRKRDVQRELVMLASASHPHIVQLKDHGIERDYIWLTMPYYVGETLSDRLKKGTLTLRKAYDIFLPIARGVDALHKAGLRHQDIKPDNIFLANFGGQEHPILLDLGVAAEIESPFVAGTPMYASPEQLQVLLGASPSGPLSGKMDTYAFAATLLRSLIGYEKYLGSGTESASTDLEQVLGERAGVIQSRASDPLPKESLPEVTGTARDMLEAAFKRWLAVDPETRTPIEEIINEMDVLLIQEREARAAKEKKEKQLRVWLAVALAAVPITGIIGYLVHLAITTRNQMIEIQEGARASLHAQEAEKFAIGAKDATTLKECQTEARKAIIAMIESKVSIASLEKQQSECKTDFENAQATANNYSNKFANCETASTATSKELAARTASLEACDENLKAASEKYKTCSKAVNECDGKLKTESKNYAECMGTVKTCKDALQDESERCRTAEGALKDEKTARERCETNLGTCPPDLKTCQSSLGTCPTDLLNCKNQCPPVPSPPPPPAPSPT